MEMETPGQEQIAIAIGMIAARFFDEHPDTTPEDFAGTFIESELEELMITREQVVAIAEGAKE